MNFSYFFAFIALAIGSMSVQAQINTVPEGISTFKLPATGVGENITSYLSAPLINDPAYTGSVSTVTGPATISIAASSTPWTANQFASPAAPYFVKFLTGQQAGRVISVVSNDASTLTLDTTDNTSQTVPLNSVTNFTVAAGDTFEVFAGDTLASMFGLNTQQSPLVLKGGTAITADSVSIYNLPTRSFTSYYFNTATGAWTQYGTLTDVNNTIIYPYSSFQITRRASEPAISFTLMGRVAEVSRLIKASGGNTAIYDSIGYPVDLPLSQLSLGPNWTKAPVPQPPQLPSLILADTISVLNPSSGLFDIYYQLQDSSWRKFGAGSTDEGNVVIPTGTTVSFLKRSFVNGSSSYLQPLLPYSLN